MTHLASDTGLVGTQSTYQVRIRHHTGVANTLATPQFIAQPVYDGLLQW
jgi:hypothetical protein